MIGKEFDFQDIYTTFKPKVFGYLSRMFDMDEAEDLTQEVFFKVDKTLKNFRGEAQIATWIYRIATNVALDRLRNSAFKQKKMKYSLGDASDNKKIEYEDKNVWTGEKKRDIDQQLIRQEMNNCIREYIDQLPESYRAVLVLSEVEGFTNREIAKILNVSINTVKIRLHRARAKLKESLSRHCNFHLDERSELACDRKETKGQ